MKNEEQEICFDLSAVNIFLTSFQTRNFDILLLDDHYLNVELQGSNPLKEFDRVAVK